ncbi:glycoside hydrolase family 127 protein [Alicyclobacillus mali]|uniref:Glycoside hydrolase family 127 protein n=1 Tax=Alicyclobacillus mali (ex Roth et al. 2021) TaxID=1123961 RepID=A0ABS0F071_9BACL|nr:beta-L-arabinofuranosidase domain-containing protein [Alicyclobacillus mali (ex Roth et al. 2021)]MBF8376699.1 glycoside hydrolase family 127 protein [Alicyclobacillus mali (ex Roth et al. 2021)]
MPPETCNPRFHLSVQLHDPFWSRYQQLVRETVLPYQYEILNDRVPGVEPSGAIRNFRIAAGLETGEFTGMVFQDSDVAKWLEAVGYALKTKRDSELERMADDVIDLVVAAQQPDGYLNTYFTIKEPGKRFTNLMDCHELYCAGHMMEAAVSYYEATGKRKLLDAMCRFADLIADTFGPGEGQIHGYDGHQEIELALVKLYGVTGEKRYLDLARYFLDARGTEPNFFLQEWERRGRKSFWWPWMKEPDLAYHQAHKPVREQDVAVGHAVRAMYMYTAMADVARLTGDETLAKACERLWEDVTRRQMYIIGAVGSTHQGEAFTFDYDLPNETAYAETCASVGLIFFAKRMLDIAARSEYADVIERALYNAVIGSMAQDGKHYCYVNPLEILPRANEENPDRRHVRPTRQAWFGCACCPPNVARLLMSLGDYVYSWHEADRTLYAHLHIGSSVEWDLDGSRVQVALASGLPWRGEASLRVSMSDGPRRFAVAVRIPGWCAGEPNLRVNGKPIAESEVCLKNGYAVIERAFTDGDEVALEFPMEARWVVGHPELRAVSGMAAIERGPLVYCVEEADHGPNLAALSVDLGAPLVEAPYRIAGVDAMALECDAYRRDGAAFQDGALYRPATEESRREHKVRLHAIPYFLWGNRGQGEMRVWLRWR